MCIKRFVTAGYIYLSSELYCTVKALKFRYSNFKKKHLFKVDMTVMVIDQVYNHDPCLRKTRESRWITTLRTSSPLGMNLRVNSL